jgi:4-amino-4-deoxy-L-arabinose transferase-like glycosyltransferase
MNEVEPMSVEPARNQERVRNAILICAILFFTVSCVGLIRTKRPWADEGWFVNISDSILTRGNTGISVLRPDGTVMAPGGVVKGINKAFYGWFPTQEACNAIFYRVFGLGDEQMRTASALWGAVLLFSLFSLVRGLTRSSLTAALTLLLCATDVAFLNAATEGRMDIMCAALWVSALACYFHFRSRSIFAALLYSNALVAFAMLTHPIGLIGFPLLGTLAVALDWRKLRFSHLFATAIPYFIAASLGALYVFNGLDAFRSQFIEAVSRSNRVPGFKDPLNLLLREFTVRIASYYLPQSSDGAQRWLRALIPLMLGMSFLGAVLSSRIRRDPGKRLLVMLTGICFLTLSFYDVAKLTYYLVDLTPLFCATAALWVVQSWQDNPRLRIPLCGFLAVLLGLQMTWTAASIKRDPLHGSFLPMAQFVRKSLDSCGKQCFVTASAELGLALGFSDSIKDDLLLGYRSGLDPDYIVMDGKAYYSNLSGLETTYPEIARYMHQVLTQKYHKVYSDGYYDVFARN